MAEGDGPLEDVVVAGIVGNGGVGAGDFEEVAKLGEEERIVGALGGSGVLPPLDKGV